MVSSNVTPSHHGVRRVCLLAGHRDGASGEGRESVVVGSRVADSLSHDGRPGAKGVGGGCLLPQGLDGANVIGS